jgi:hypothetical protein
MMKKGTIISIVVLVLVLGAFFATRKEVTNTVQVPYVVKAVEDLARVELTRPKSELVIFEKSDSGWSMTKPVNAPIDRAVEKELEAIFAGEIRTDDLRFSKDKVEAYELTEELGTKVSLYGKGASAASVEFTIGKEMDIDGRVRRSFIKTDKGKAYRAQRSLEVLRQPVDDLRSKTILNGDRNEVSNIKITSEDGVIELSKKGDEWQMISPVAAMPLESSIVQGAVSLVSRLRATGFADDKKPSEVGLDPPRATVVARVGDADVSLDVTHVGANWYVRKRGEPFIYTVGSSTGNGLVPDVASLRDRVPMRLATAEIQTIEFEGAEKVIVTRNGESWTMLKPSKKEVSPKVFGPLFQTLSELKIARYVDINPSDAGLDKSQERIILRSKGVKNELVLGATLEGTTDRYAKWTALPLIFIIPGPVAARLIPTSKDLVDL